MGVGVAEDLGKLQRDFGLPFRHFLDLGVSAQVTTSFFHSTTILILIHCPAMLLDPR